MNYIYHTNHKIIFLLNSMLFFLCFSSFAMENLPPLYKHIAEGNTNGISQLCKQGLHPDLFYKEHVWGIHPPPLIFALLHTNNQTDVIKTLIEYKADCNFKCSYDTILLNTSYIPVLPTAITKQSSLETIRILLTHGAQSTYYDDLTRESLFHRAASKKNGEVMCDLLVENLCPHSLTKQSQALSTHFLVAQKKKRTLFAQLPKPLMLKILSFMLPPEEARFLPHPHNKKALKNKKALYKYVFQHNKKLFEKSSSGKTPQEIAFKNKNKALAELLDLSK